MITGAHSIVFSSDPDADRRFFLEVLGLPHVDVGGGWLIFALPPAEVAVHGAEDSAGSHELYLMCDDIGSFIADMRQREVECTDVQDAGWGLMTQVTMPGGGKLGVYEPRHARPTSAASALPRRAGKKVAKKAGKKVAKKAGKKVAKKAGKPKPAVTVSKAKKKAKKKR